MPANHKVSVAWQIVFTFTPIVNFWAFHRVGRLTKYVLYVILPTIGIAIPLSLFIFVTTNLIITERQSTDIEAAIAARDNFTQTFSYVPILNYVISAGFQAISIYLVIRWSRRYNQQFDQTAMQR